MSEQGIGNIAYSFDKKKYYEILENNEILFVTYYIFTIFISTFFITGSFLLHGVSVGRYITVEKTEDGKEIKIENRKLYNYFDEFCLGSPYDIISMHKQGIKEILTPQDIKDGNEQQTFIGFKQNTYIFLIITNLIGIFILIEALLKNLMSSIIVNFVQTNPNNNPYNNPNCITKIDDSPMTYINANYSKLLSLSFLFLIPFTTTFILRYVLKMDKYDIKKTDWIKKYIFASLVIPTILIIFYRITGHSSITLFSTINKFIDSKDLEYIGFIKQMFSLKFFILYMFIFIVFTFLILHWIYGVMNKFVTGIWKYVYYIFILVTIYLIIPKILASNAISTVYNIFKKDNVDGTESEIISNIEKYGCQSIYDIIVKYNYPCFKK